MAGDHDVQHNQLSLSAGSQRASGDVSANDMSATILEQHVKDLTSILNYFGSESLEPEEALRLLPIAGRLSLRPWTQKLASVLVTSVTFSNCIQIYQLAGNLELNELSDTAYIFISEHFQQVSLEHEDFGLLTVSELSALLWSDDLMVSEEVKIYHAIARWTMADSVSRRELVPDLFQLLRLSCCDRNSLIWMRDHQLVQGFESVKSAIQSAISSYGNVTQQKLANQQQRGRAARQKRLEEELLCQQFRTLEVGWQTPRDVLFLFGGYPSEHGKVEILNKSGSRWVALADVSDPPRGQTWSVPMGKNILIIEANGQKVRSFDPLTGEWQSRAALPFVRYNFSVAVLLGKVYVLGGRNAEDQMQDRCDAYDPVIDEWTQVASLNVPRRYSGVIAFKGEIYCTGGWDDESRLLDSMEIYDPNKNRWILSPVHLTSPRRSHSLATSCGHHVWSFGGYDGKKATSVVERLDLKKGEWEEMTPMPTPRQQPTVAVLGSHVHVIGGWNSEGNLDITEIFDPVSKTWSEGPKINGTRYWMGATVLQIPGC